MIKLARRANGLKHLATAVSPFPRSIANDADEKFVLVGITIDIF